MIPEREREALEHLTMCAREECIMCKYHKECDFDFQYELATKNMNILADALRKTESSSEKPNNCEDLQDWKDRMWAEAVEDEPQTDGEYLRSLKKLDDKIKERMDCPWK